MSASPLDRLARRRDVVLRAAKILLIAATLLWLVLMALYDITADTAAHPTILLTSRTAFLLRLAPVDTIDLQRVWGGPATLYGVHCLVGTLGSVGLLALARAWLNHAALSRLGVALAVIAIGLGIATIGFGAGPVHPATLAPEQFARLAAAIEAREPGLIARLRAGERPDLPAMGGAARHLMLVDGNRLVEKVPPGTPLLRDRDDAEALRFALAEQAYAAGDMATLRRLLPIALAMPPTDRPARNDFARRLVDMGTAAGIAPVSPADRVVTGERAARWHAMLDLVRRARILLQILLWSGLVCLVTGLILRWSHHRIVAQLARRAAFETPARRRTASGVTPI